MKDPLKPRDKITQKMTRDGAIAENQTTGDTERISKRTQDADFQKSPEQQTAQDAAAQLMLSSRVSSCRRCVDFSALSFGKKNWSTEI